VRGSTSVFLYAFTRRHVSLKFLDRNLSSRAISLARIGARLSPSLACDLFSLAMPLIYFVLPRRRLLRVEILQILMRTLYYS